MTHRNCLLLLLTACAACAPADRSHDGAVEADAPRLFRAVAPYDVHVKPWTLRPLDVDADGDLDVVVGGEALTVLVNDGSGALVAGPTFDDLVQAIDVVLGDLDGDGRPEVLVAEHDAPEPRFLALRVGADGALQPLAASPYVVDAEPHLHTLAVLDLDGDGALDIVTDSWPESRLVLVRGTGDGRFEVPGRQLAVPPAPMQNLVAADFDGDGVRDVATPAHDRDALTVMLGDGAGSLRAAPGSPFAYHGGFTTLATADIDGDGDADVLAVHRSDRSTQYRVDALSVMANDGRASFAHAPGSPHTGLPERSNDLAIGDVDGDGRLDVVVLGETDQELALLLGTAEGLVEAGRQRFAGRARGCALADLDGDGRAELLISEHANGKVTRFAYHLGAATEADRENR